MRTYKLALTVVALTVASLAAAQQISASVNGKNVRFPDVQPMMMNGRVMVPLRGVFEQMGASVHWDAAAMQVHAQGNGRECTLHINDRYATVNGSTVEMDTPAVMVRGRTMVPLRFVGEALGADVAWHADTRNVAITTSAVVAESTENAPVAGSIFISRSTVLPVKLNQPLSSKEARVGDRFTATIDTMNARDYVGLPAGTKVEGYVDAVTAKTDDAPGVLSLAFERLRLPDGRSMRIDGSLIGLDDKSVENKDGRLVAKSGAATKDTKYVGIGAGAGAIIALVTKGNVLTSAVIGAALGYIYGQVEKPKEYRDVQLKSGDEFGVMLNRDVTF